VDITSTILRVLREQFGRAEFHAGQEQIITSCWEARMFWPSCLVVSPLLIAQTKGSLRLISGGLFGNEAPATLSATSRSTERRYNVYLLLEFQARNQEAPIYLLQFERLIDL
jgi:hypothetical protein